MLFVVSLLTIPLALIAAVPSPNVPGGTDTYTVGGNCTIAWIPDASGLWSNMNIELMTGPNSPMIHMRTVATVDAQKTTSYSWPCPAVTPNSAIYFYQFSSAQDTVYTTWSTRFLIAGTDGFSTTPANVSDAGTPYGIGYFVDPSQYNAPPSYLIGNGQILGAPNNNTLPSPPSTATSTGSSSTRGGKASGTSTSLNSPTSPRRSSDAASLTDAMSWLVVTVAALFGATVVGL